MHRRIAGQCELCARQLHLTEHHLIPRKLHRRKHFKKNFTVAQLQQTVALCRQCHVGVHKLYSEMQLGKVLNTIEKLAADPLVKKHINWVARQRVQCE